MDYFSILEALDRPRKIDGILGWTKRSDSWITHIEFGSHYYYLGFVKTDNLFVTLDGAPIPAWNLGFTKTNSIPGTAEPIIGGQPVFEIFSTMKAALVEFVNEEKPEAFAMGANINQQSRTRLYDRFAKMIDSEAASLGYKRVPAKLSDDVKIDYPMRVYLWTR